MSRKQSKRAAFYARQRDLRSYPVSEVIHSRTPEGRHRMEIFHPQAQKRLELMGKLVEWRGERLWSSAGHRFNAGEDALIAIAWPAGKRP